MARPTIRSAEIKDASGNRDGYLTTPEVAQRYRTADSTVRYWRMINYGPKGVKVGRRTLYPMAEIERFDRELKEQGGAA